MRNPVEELRVRIVKDLLDAFVLATLKNKGIPISGYDVIHSVRREFDIIISSGTVYTLLYSMERENLIKGEKKGGRRVYTLTKKGDRIIETVLAENRKIAILVEKLLTGRR